ncbi:MAG: hypothetical protein SFU98_06865 [Leptospiraceae bacterium]|nr:hypothetical protein [Leptospiraceae bacterium]
MSILKILLIVFVILIVFIGIFLVYMGAFMKPIVSAKNSERYFFVHKEIDGGDFSKVGSTTTEIHSILDSNGIKEAKPFQIYFPPEENRNSKIGFVLHENDYKSLPKTNLNSEILESTECMMVSFPWKNSFSYIFSYMPVKKSLESHRQINNYKNTYIMVLNNGNEILYIQPIVK